VALADSHGVVSSAAGSKKRSRASSLPAWLVLIGALLPVEASVYIADARLTPSRLIIFLLLPQAFVALFQRKSRFALSDLLIFLTAAWMVYTGYSSSTVSSSAAEALELFGGYVVGRAFFFDRESLENFVRVLKVVTTILIALAVADIASGRFFVHDLAASLLHVDALFPTYRSGWIRATSSLDHPILYGVFCTFAAAIFLYSEPRPIKRVLLVGLCIFGCLISQSSAAFLSMALVLAVYAYDRLLLKFRWRWQLLNTIVVVFIAFVFLLSNNPVGWLVSHLTLDPQTGYYRIMIWDVATTRIAMSPFVGWGIILFNDQILDNTVDAIWLVISLRFGIPMAVLLLLGTLTTFLPGGRRSATGDVYLDRIRTAFTLVLVTYLTVGLTAHFWNYMWIFWGLCAGIRASLNGRRTPTGGKTIQGRAPSMAQIRRVRDTPHPA
jgi:hypothetical protein